MSKPKVRPTIVTATGCDHAFDTLRTVPAGDPGLGKASEFLGYEGEEAFYRDLGREFGTILFFNTPGGYMEGILSSLVEEYTKLHGPGSVEPRLATLDVYPSWIKESL